MSDTGPWQNVVKVKRIGDHIIIDGKGAIVLGPHLAVALALDILHAAGVDLEVKRGDVDKLIKRYQQ